MTREYLIVYMYHTFFIHFSIDELLVASVSTIVNSSALNIGVHVSFWIMVFSGYTPSNGIAGLYLFLVF